MEIVQTPDRFRERMPFNYPVHQSGLLIEEYFYQYALHTDEGVTLDLNYWFPKIRKGGMISGHDYNHSNFPGVSDAVNRFSEQNGLSIVEADGHVWWAIKE